MYTNIREQKEPLSKAKPEIKNQKFTQQLNPKTPALYSIESKKQTQKNSPSNQTSNGYNQMAR